MSALFLSTTLTCFQKGLDSFYMIFVRFLDALAVQVFIVRRRWKVSMRWNKGVTAEKGGGPDTTAFVRRGLKFSVEFQWERKIERERVAEEKRDEITHLSCFDVELARSRHVAWFMHERGGISQAGDRPFSSLSFFPPLIFSSLSPDPVVVCY